MARPSTRKRRASAVAARRLRICRVKGHKPPGEMALSSTFPSSHPRQMTPDIRTNVCELPFRIKENRAF